MLSWFAKPLDWLAIRIASAAMARSAIPNQCNSENIRIPEPFLSTTAPEVPSLDFHSASSFTYSSPIQTPWAVNNVVHGRFDPSADASKGNPTVVLLHGWNAEHCYQYLFPWIGRHLASRGIGAVAIELPYHGHRRPRQPGAVHDFISSDLGSMIQAVQQAIADVRALIGWLSYARRGPVIIWGFSLGAWLAGLTASVEPRLGAAILTTPIAEMDRAIQELAFCAPVRAGLHGTAISLSPFNLAHYHPSIARERILIMGSRYDCFAPLSTLEGLRTAWQGAVFWILPHGHISILMALPSLLRSMDWISNSFSCWRS